MLNIGMFRRARGGQQTCAAFFLLAATSVICIAPPALAKPEAGKLSGTIHGGVDIPIDGDVHKGATVTVPDLGPLNPALAGVAGELRIEKRSQKKVYDEGYNVGVELGYGLSDSSEVFGAVRHNWNGKSTLQVGNAVAPPTSTTLLPINATFGKQKSDSIEVGYRQYFGGGGLQPYGALRGGIALHNRVNASFAIPAANIAINNARFYKKSTTFSGGLDLGLSYDIGTSVSIQAETGLRYQSKLKDDDTDLAGLGLSAINDTGGRLTVPITLRLRAGF
jgi:hypothetical protein